MAWIKAALILAGFQEIEAGDWNLQGATILEDCTSGKPVSYNSKTSPVGVKPESFTCLSKGDYAYASCVPFGSGDSCPAKPWWGVKLPSATKAQCAFIKQHGNPLWTCLRLGAAVSDDGNTWTPVKVSADGSSWTHTMDAADCKCPSQMCDVATLGVKTKPSGYAGGVLFHMDVKEPKAYYKIECASDTFDANCAESKGCPDLGPPPAAVPSKVPSVEATVSLDIFEDAACTSVNEAQLVVELKQDKTDGQCWRSFMSSMAFKATCNSDTGAIDVLLYQTSSGGSLSCTGESRVMFSVKDSVAKMFANDRACTNLPGSRLYAKLEAAVPGGSVASCPDVGGTPDPTASYGFVSRASSAFMQRFFYILSIVACLSCISCD